MLPEPVCQRPVQVPTVGGIECLDQPLALASVPAKLAFLSVNTSKGVHFFHNTGLSS